MAPRYLRAAWIPLLAVSAPLAAQGRTWALTNARIETVSGPVIPRGTIVIRDGLIAAVGPGVQVPANAQVIDLAGKTVSPGLIDLTSTIGLPSATEAAGQGGGGGGGRFGGGGRLNPMDADRAVAEELTGGTSELKAARESGVTTLLVAPNRGLFRGLSALITAGDTLDPHAVIKAPVAEHVGYHGAGFGTYPGSLMGVIAFQRQTLYDAAHYGMVRDRWRSDPRGAERPAHDAGLEALVPVVRGELPVFIDARNENELRRAARLAKEHNLKMVLVGAVEGWRALDAVQGLGLAVAVNFPQPSQVTGWKYRVGLVRTPGDSTAVEAEARKLIEGNPAALHAAGVRFALTSGGTGGATYLGNIRKAIDAGLPADVALQAATIRAAELAGMERALGSIESGKIANLVVSQGPLLGDSGRVEMVFVDGKRYDAPPPAARGNAGGRGAAGGGGAGGPGGGGAAVQVAGTWALVSESPQGTNEGTLTVTQNGATLTGTMSTVQFGSSPISDGRVVGRRMSWALTLNFGGQEFTLTYSGQVDGNRISGTVTAGEFGSFPFTGEKRP